MTYEEWWDSTDKDGTPFVNYTFGEEAWQARTEDLLKAARITLNASSSGSSDYVSGFANGVLSGARQTIKALEDAAK